ncbi:MAG TPA: transglycosylase domain-containing protein [Bacteroidales bacterium]|nr:transglycosylase domain-containing protein [Bacteroidales bacterium]
MDTSEQTINNEQKSKNPFLRAIQFIYSLLKWLWIMKNKFFSFIKKGIFKIVPYLEKPVWPAKIIRKFLKYTFNFFLFVFIYFFAVIINFLWLFGSSPSIDKDKGPEMAVSSELYTCDSVLIGKYFNENRAPVEYGEINKNILNALIATEDARFYDHSGIDLKATFSVFWYIIKGDNRGGSTITQQLAKNLYKTRKTSRGLLGYVPFMRTIVVKSKEWVTAVKLEHYYSKEEILTMYLNAVDFGSNSFGIKVASKTYFNKLPVSLNIQEAATLVGMLKAPTTFSPAVHPQKSLERRNTVLSQMLKYNYITQHEFDSISKLPIVLNYSVEDPTETELGSYIRSAVATYLKDWCKESGYDIYTSGLKIYTSIDSKLQKYAEKSVEEQMKILQRRFKEHWGDENPWIDENDNEIENFIEDQVKKTALYKKLLKRYDNNIDSVNAELNRPHKMKLFSWKKGEEEFTMSSLDSIRYMKRFLNAGFVVMDPFTGKVLAWVGGINYKYFKYDHVNQAKRQPGSTFKPFVYCAAIDKGWSPCDRIVDQQVTIKYKEDGKDMEWSPHNADWEYTGREMTLRHAMAKSCNSVTVQLSEKIGFQTVADYAKKLGITAKLKPVPSIGLGSNDVTLLEMVAAYSVFMNQGIYSEPMLVLKITDRDGKLIKEFKPKQKQVLSKETAWLMTYMLKGGLEEPGGTSQQLWEYADIFGGNDIGGKTGTSSNYSDGWFMGVTKDIVAGSWVGGEERCIHFRKEEHMEGCHSALPIFGFFMTKVYDNKYPKITKGKFPEPSIKISKKYYCPTAWEKKDTTDTDDADKSDSLKTKPKSAKTKSKSKKKVKKTEEKCKDCP